MDNSISRTSPDSNRSSFETGETSPLLGKQKADAVDKGFWSCFRGLSAGASNLGRGFAACCSSVARPILSAYHFVVDKLNLPPKENKISYAWRTIDISVDRNVKAEVPKSGSFRAGEELRSKLVSKIVANTVERLNTGDASVEQFQRDMKGSTSYILKDGADERRINYRDEQDSNKASVYQADDALHSLSEFVGGNVYVTQAVAAVANQQLGTKSGDVLGEALEGSANIIAIPAGSTATARLEYSIEKENEDSFIVHYHESDQGSQAGQAPALLVKNQEGGINYITPDSSSVEKKLSLRVTRNKDFDSNFPITKDNLPCHIECLDFTTSYEVSG